MTRNRRIVIFLLFLALFLAMFIPLISYVLWRTDDERPLRVLILDKTVIDPNVSEHISFNWVLEHMKFVKSPGTFYDPVNDYKGFYPLGEGRYAVRDYKGYTPEQLDSVSLAHDIAYFTDTYGIYNEEWDIVYPKEGNQQSKRITGQLSGILYGGTDQEDVDLLRRFSAQGKLVLTEFNVIATPTPEPVRRSFEELYDVNWTGWTGRFFLNLENTPVNELPTWIVREYEAQWKRKWAFMKSGLVLVHESGRILVLEQDTHLNSSVPVIHTPESERDRYGLPETMPYPFWFDITLHGPRNRTVASYHLDPNPEGKALLDSLRIPTIYPAVIASNPDEPPFYYFSGDFADNPINMSLTVFRYVHVLDGLLYDRSIENRGGFFWNFYRPMVMTILDEHIPAQRTE
jgi:hypothetical protein